MPMAQPMPVLGPNFRGQVPPVQVTKRAPAPDLPGSLREDSAVIVTVPRKVDMGPNGKVKLDVYTIPLAKRLPKDQSYRVASGDTLEALARRFKVTPRSIQVANALKSPRLERGSYLRIPGSFAVALNNQQIAFDVAPRIENGLPLAPLRQIFEHAGGVVVWYEETREVRAATADRDVKLRIGSKEAKINQMVVVMDKEAFIDSGRTIVPVSFVQKALDLSAEYDPRSGTINLVKK